MQVTVTFKNLEHTDALKAYVKTKLDRFDRFFNNPAEAAVVLTVEKSRQIAEINVIGDRLTLNAKEETMDMHQAIDTACDKLDYQIKKNKEKLQNKRAGGKRPMDLAERFTAEQDEDDDDEESNIKFEIEAIEYKPMDIEEALEQIEMDLKKPFLIFMNARDGKVNMIYRKKDGGLKLIQPN